MNINCNAPSDLLATTHKPAPGRKEAADLTTGRSEAVVKQPSIDAASNEAAAALPQGPFGPGDMEGLMKSWGQANSQYDLDANGTVDVDDLIAMIMNWQEPAEPTPTPTPIPTPTLTPNADTVGLDAAVDVAIEVPVPETRPVDVDLGTLNAVTGPGETKPPTPSPASGSVDANVASGPTCGEPLPPAANSGGGSEIDNLMAAWGQRGSRYDLDGNGVVDVDDLINMILNWGSGPASPAAPPVDVAQALGGNTDASEIKPTTAQEVAIDKPGRFRSQLEADSITHVKPHKPAPTPSLSKEALSTVSTSLVDRLMSAGFTDRPPTNIRDIVDSLNLSPRDAKSVMRSLKHAYPDGLGVNLRV